jgi:hypothetical protein
VYLPTIPKNEALRLWRKCRMHSSAPDYLPSVPKDEALMAGRSRRLRRLPLSRRAARADLSHKGRGNLVRSAHHSKGRTAGTTTTQGHSRICPA